MRRHLPLSNLSLMVLGVSMQLSDMLTFLLLPAGVEANPFASGNPVAAVTSKAVMLLLVTYLLYRGIFGRAMAGFLIGTGLVAAIYNVVALVNS